MTSHRYVFWPWSFLVIITCWSSPIKKLIASNNVPKPPERTSSSRFSRTLANLSWRGSQWACELTLLALRVPSKVSLFLFSPPANFEITWCSNVLTLKMYTKTRLLCCVRLISQCEKDPCTCLNMRNAIRLCSTR